ncbi:MAG: hypothetical protein AB8B53_14355 [Flavobacteriales bacterium]
MQLNKNLPSHARVWVYQCKEDLSSHVSYIQQQLGDFMAQWQTHGVPVAGDFDIVYGHFIVIAADESKAGVSGCSIDSVVSVIDQIGKSLKKDLFDRMAVFYEKNGRIESCHLHDLAHLVEKGEVKQDTVMINTLVKTLGEYENEWLKPLKDSWHNKMVV